MKSQKSKKLKDLADLNKKFVINLANENFTDADYSVLGRGLKFVDIPKETQAYLLDRDVEQLMGKMRSFLNENLRHLMMHLYDIHNAEFRFWLLHDHEYILNLIKYQHVSSGVARGGQGDPRQNSRPPFCPPNEISLCTGVYRDRLFLPRSRPPWENFSPPLAPSFQKVWLRHCMPGYKLIDLQNCSRPINLYQWLLNHLIKFIYPWIIIMASLKRAYFLYFMSSEVLGLQKNPAAEIFIIENQQILQ